MEEEVDDTVSTLDEKDEEESEEQKEEERIIRTLTLPSLLASSVPCIALSHLES